MFFFSLFFSSIMKTQLIQRFFLPLYVHIHFTYDLFVSLVQSERRSFVLQRYKHPTFFFSLFSQPLSFKSGFLFPAKKETNPIFRFGSIYDTSSFLLFIFIFIFFLEFLFFSIFSFTFSCCSIVFFFFAWRNNKLDCEKQTERVLKENFVVGAATHLRLSPPSF